MEYIKFIQQDPRYSGNVSEVVVNVAHIVKIEPLWYRVEESGKRWQIHVGPDDDSEAIDENVHRIFMVSDSLGNQYSSEKATEQGQKLIERIWNSAQ